VVGVGFVGGLDGGESAVELLADGAGLVVGSEDVGAVFVEVVDAGDGRDDGGGATFGGFLEGVEFVEGYGSLFDGESEVFG